MVVELKLGCAVVPASVPLWCVPAGRPPLSAAETECKSPQCVNRRQGAIKMCGCSCKCATMVCPCRKASIVCCGDCECKSPQCVNRRQGAIKIKYLIPTVLQKMYMKKLVSPLFYSQWMDIMVIGTREKINESKDPNTIKEAVRVAHLRLDSSPMKEKRKGWNQGNRRVTKIGTKRWSLLVVLRQLRIVLK
ncbi:uncharacterized protein LOC122947446 isoform X1 [Acropora millepora]|uniref:uncharacterized protein LOC122947446 isoform X1 n=1 Tax=Acropora millepora TaxID=45264 RepID=UPI001CF2565A|nr:uncharacterized protein LOC122947446 isoform X1 [Acropora millepora]